jgi:hypothetical protein
MSDLIRHPENQLNVIPAKTGIQFTALLPGLRPWRQVKGEMDQGRKSGNLNPDFFDKF